MNDRKISGLSVLVLTVIFLLCLISSESAYAQYRCIPSCEIDARFMMLSGQNLETTNNTDAFFHFVSPAGLPDLEIGIFDGDSQGRWDIANAPFIEVEFTLFFDPDGNGLGTGNGVVYRTWTSDGSAGDNMGMPMPDSDWFTQILANDPQAQTATGSFSYVLRSRIIDPMATAANVFKIRTNRIVSIPAGEAFNYVVTFRTLEDILTIYPNFDGSDPTCFNPAPTAMGGFGIRLFCDPADPICCIHETTYDGTWEFVFNVPDNITTLDLWDGDLDYGSASANSDATACINPDGVNVDTDDPNTPIPLPPWAIGTDAVPQGVSSPTNPPDDNDCSPANNRPPSIIYELIDPNGVAYLNDNPSGNVEWELFNLSTEPFDPLLYDIHVDDIPVGEWRVFTTGNSLQNANSMRVPFAICGIDNNGLSTCPTVRLDVTIIGNGDGGVVSTNPGIDCSSLGADDCEEIYNIGTQVTLTAAPEPLSYFVGWSGDPACTGDPTNPVLNLDMTMDISCIAEFELLPVLDVIIQGNGTCTVTSEPEGIDCPDDCSEIIDPPGTTVNLDAEPDPVSIFVDWTGDCDDLNPDTSITVFEDSTCIVTCILTEFVLNPIFPALDDNINFISAENAYPGGNVAFIWGKKPGQFALGGRICSGTTFGINNPKLLAIERANEFGVATYIFYIPLFSDFEFSIQLQALDIQTCRTSNQIDQIIRKEEGG